MSGHQRADAVPSDVASPADLAAAEEDLNIDAAVEEAVHDTSPAARRGRRNAMLRAVFGELIATTIFIYVNCAVAVHTNVAEFTPGAAAVAGALAASFTAIALIYAFADVSGAHFNPAVTFATWITSRTSNRKFVLYIVAQLIGSNLACLGVYSTFNGDETLLNFIAIQPGPNAHVGSVFAVELYLTFILVFIVFAVAFEDVDQQKKSLMSFKGIANSRGLTLYAANPQSKTGFAPIAIGFALGGLALVGGSVSGGCFNPARLFGPALWSGVWSYHYVYWLAEFAGAALAAFVRYLFGRYGLPGDLYVKKRRDASPLPLSLPEVVQRSNSTHEIAIKQV